MASVFAHLLETLPFVIGVNAARNASGYLSGDLPVAQLWPYLRAIPRDTEYSPPAPPLPSSSTDYTARRLWRWTHAGSAPHRISQLTCRVRDTGYKTQVVTDSLEWGYEAPGGSIEPHVRVVTEDDRALSLPLSLDYLHSRWLVPGGYLAEMTNLMYPLESYLDYSLVLAFAYELSGPSGVSPYRPRADDPSEEAIRQSQSGPSGCPDSDADRWVRRAMTGDFMPGAMYRPASVSPGATTRVSTSAPRVLVAISLATCRERADFEPGGIVGMARFYPHIMVRASVPLRSIHGGVRFTRPTRTTALDQGDGTVRGTCCNAHEEIRSLLVGDANENPWGMNDFFKPFWSGTFSHVEIDPDVRLRGQVLHVVRRDRPRERTITSCGARDLPDSPQTLRDVLKMPRQGEFDNIHVAPRLRLQATQIVNDFFGGLDGTMRIPINAARMRFDPIVMAPFCAHDCMHMHWRWSPGSSPRWILGWGAGSAGPHFESGVPLTPPNHDVDLTIHGPNVFTYMEHAHPTSNTADDATRTIPARHMQFLVYAGAAYAQGVMTWNQAVGASVTRWMAERRANSSSSEFEDASGRRLTAINTPAVLYWNLRYYVHRASDGQFEAREWIQMSQSDVDRARRG